MARLTKPIAIAGMLTVLTAAPALAQTKVESGAPLEKGAIEFSPVSPFIGIYAAQYVRHVATRTDLILGFAYVNIEYDQGQSHAPTGILGVRQYFWRGAHLEYQLWPSYNWYYENVEQRYYNGAELWNEFRPGYTFDFRLGRAPMFVNLQYLIGFGLYGDQSKPQSWKDQRDREGELYTAPMVFLGWRF